MSKQTNRALMCVLALAAGSSGCASTARYMAEVKPSRALTAPTGQALVVFVRPSKFGYAVAGNILDENGRFLGDAPAKGHFATVLPPGRHVFTTWAENTDALVADLAPGKTYFVEVYMTMGVWSGHMHLKAIKPTLENWQKRDGWMQETTQFAVDEAGGQQNLQRKGADRVAERLQRGREAMARYQGEELDSRTLSATDGI